MAGAPGAAARGKSSRSSRALGTTLKRLRKYDLSNAYGMLSLPNHLVLVRSGMVVDPEPGGATLWEVDDFLHTYGVRPGVLLVRPRGLTSAYLFLASASSAWTAFRYSASAAANALAYSSSDIFAAFGSPSNFTACHRRR